MTREEQIEKAWLAFAVQSIYRYDEKSVKDAIKWADEHPNLCEEEQVGMNELGMMWQKQALIKKACEYLKSLVYQEFGGGPIERTFSDEDIERFKKAMEE